MKLSHLLSLAALALPAAAHAHEFWLQPASFHAEVGSVVPFRLYVGDAFPGESVARNPVKIEKFAVSGASGAEMPIVGRPGSDPAGMMRFPEEGTYVAVYDSSPSFVSVDPTKFNKYLADKGLTEPARVRESTGKTMEPGRELFSRCAKTILTVGTGSMKGFDRDFGMRLEIVPEAHPALLAPGSELPAHILFEGKPLANATVIATHPGRAESITIKTDSSGRFSMKLPTGGMWLLSCVHMVPAPATNPTGEQADWESLWASLTFEVPVKAEAAASK